MRKYRGYGIEHRNGKHIARPLDGDDMKIVSVYEPRVRAVIDGMYDALEQYPAVALNQAVGLRVVREWIANPISVIDADDAYRRGALC